MHGIDLAGWVIPGATAVLIGLAQALCLVRAAQRRWRLSDPRQARQVVHVPFMLSVLYPLYLLLVFLTPPLGSFTGAAAAITTVVVVPAAAVGLWTARQLRSPAPAVLFGAGAILATAANVSIGLLAGRSASPWVDDARPEGSLVIHVATAAAWLLPAGLGLAAWARACPSPGRGTCLGCGYDLTGTPRGWPCPECGREWEGRGPGAVDGPGAVRGADGAPTPPTSPPPPAPPA